MCSSFSYSGKIPEKFRLSSLSSDDFPCSASSNDKFGIIVGIAMSAAGTIVLRRNRYPHPRFSLFPRSPWEHRFCALRKKMATTFGAEH